MKKIIVLLSVLSILGCDSPQTDYAGLNSTLWMQSSAEYVASVKQAFNIALMNLEDALRDKSWTAALEQEKYDSDVYRDLPTAVIFDVDETVLDNSPYQAALVKSGQAFHPESWGDWVNKVEAEAIQGVKELIEKIKDKGVAVFYVTNRNETLEEATVQNIRATVDADADADNVFCKDEYPGGSDKSSRRAAIAETHRIIMMFGDDYNDFRYLGKSLTAKERVAEVQSDNEYWGSKWILISNPSYGSWERAIYNYDYNLPADEKQQAKLNYLKADRDMSE